MRLSSAPVAVGRGVQLEFPTAGADLVDGAAGRLARVRAAVDVLEGLWPVEWAPESLVALGQAGRRAGLDPSTAVEELSHLHETLVLEMGMVRTLKGEPALVTRALAILGGR